MSHRGSLLPNEHLRSINVVRYDPSGNYAISGSSDKQIVIWNLEERKAIKKLRGHCWEVLGLSISAEKSTIASVGGDRCVFVWDVATGTIKEKLFGHTQKVNSVQFYESSLIATGSYDATVRIWDARSSKRNSVQVLADAKDSISSVVMGSTVIISGSIDGNVRWYDARTGQVFQDCVVAPVTNVVFNLDHSALLVNTLKSELYLLDRDSGCILIKYAGMENEKFKISSALSHDNSRVYSGSEDKKLYCWQLTEEKEEFSVNADSVVNCVDCHPTKDQFLAADDKGQLRIFE